MGGSPPLLRSVCDPSEPARFPTLSVPNCTLTLPLFAQPMLVSHFAPNPNQSLHSGLRLEDPYFQVTPAPAPRARHATNRTSPALCVLGVVRHHPDRPGSTESDLYGHQAREVHRRSVAPDLTRVPQVDWDGVATRQRERETARYILCSSFDLFFFRGNQSLNYLT